MVLAAAVDAVLTGPAITRSLAAALAADPAALLVGAPPVVGTLISELRARGADLPDPSCTRCGRTGKPLTRSPSGGCLRPVPATATRRGVCPVWCGQTRRRPRRTGPAGVRAVRRPTPAALRAMRTDPADRPPRPRRDPRHLRRVLPTTRGGLLPLPATPAVFVRERTGTGLHPLRGKSHRGLRALRRGPPTNREMARGTGLRPLLQRCATPPRHLHHLWCHAQARGPTRPGRDDLRRLRRHPPPLTRAQAAGSRTNSTKKADAHPARCGAGPRNYWPVAPSRSHPHWHRSIKIGRAHV